MCVVSKTYTSSVSGYLVLKVLLAKRKAREVDWSKMRGPNAEEPGPPKKPGKKNKKSLPAFSLFPVSCHTHSFIYAMG
jgi:hypothetical protein